LRLGSTRTFLETRIERVDERCDSSWITLEGGLCGDPIYLNVNWIEKKNSRFSLESHSETEEMSGTLDWVLKEPMYTEKVFREKPGMSVVWDWTLKEPSRSSP